MHTMAWDDLRYFLELARHKRLLHAGHKLGVDHTTVARRVEQLEQALACRLFESTSDGYVLDLLGKDGEAKPDRAVTLYHALEAEAAEIERMNRPALPPRRRT